jgi:hypothetical protein
MSFPLPLIILLSSWLLWGCQFNSTSVQPKLYLAHLLSFPPLLNFVAPFGGIKILGVPFNSTSFTSYFLQEALGEDV